MSVPEDYDQRTRADWYFTAGEDFSSQVRVDRLSQIRVVLAFPGGSGGKLTQDCSGLRRNQASDELPVETPSPRPEDGLPASAPSQDCCDPPRISDRGGPIHETDLRPPPVHYSEREQSQAEFERSPIADPN